MDDSSEKFIFNFGNIFHFLISFSNLVNLGFFNNTNKYHNIKNQLL